MSIINKVLKDLDKRGSEPFRDDHSSSAVAMSSRRSTPLLILFAVLVLAAAIIATYLIASQANNPSTTAAAVSQEVTPQPYKPVKEVTPTEVEEAAETPVTAEQLPADPQTKEEPAPASELETEPRQESEPESEQEPSQTEPAAPSLVKKAVSLSPAELAAQHAEKASAAQQQGRLDDAERHWQKALLVMPSNKDYRQQLAALQYGRGKISQALVTLNEGMQRQPMAHELRLLSAKILQKEGQTETALLLLQKASPAATEHTDYYQLQARLAQQLERYQVAADSYQQLIHAQPNQGRWYLGRAIALESFDSTQALEVYRQALTRLSHPPSQAFVKQRIQQLEQSQ